MNDEAPKAARPSQNRRETLLLEAVKGGGDFDVDVFHVMEERDDALIRDQVLNGVTWEKFVYSFEMDGKTVTGISVLGAAHLMNEYGGLKHKLIASVQKVGSVFTFTSYPDGDRGMAVTCSVIRELADEPDYYECVVEVMDIKRGNSIQMAKREEAQGHGRGGKTWDKPHYQIIAQSKAYRNCVLRLVPQDDQQKFKERQLKAGKGEAISDSVIETKRDGVLQYAVSKGLVIDKDAVRKLEWAAINGLSEAARQGLEQFVAAARAAGIFHGEVMPGPDAGKPPPPPPAAKQIESNKENPVGSPAAATQQRQPDPAVTSTGTPTSPPAAQQATPAAAPPIPSTEPPQAKRGKGTKTTAAPDQQQAPTQQQEMLSPPPPPATAPPPPPAAAPPAKDNPFKFG